MLLVTQKDFESKAGQEKIVRSIHALEQKVHELEQKLHALQHQEIALERNVTGQEV